MLFGVTLYPILLRQQISTRVGTEPFVKLAKSIQHKELPLSRVQKSIEIAFVKSVRRDWFDYSAPDSPERLLWQENLLSPVLLLSRVPRKGPDDVQYFRSSIWSYLKHVAELRVPDDFSPPTGMSQEEFVAISRVLHMRLMSITLSQLRTVASDARISSILQVVGKDITAADGLLLSRNFAKAKPIYQRNLFTVKNAIPCNYR